MRRSIDIEGTIVTDCDDKFGGYFSMREQLTEEERQKVFAYCAKAGNRLDKASGMRGSRQLRELERAEALIDRARSICSNLKSYAVPSEAFQPLFDRIWKMMEGSLKTYDLQAKSAPDEIAEKMNEIFTSLTFMVDMRNAPIAARLVLVKKAAWVDAMFADEIRALDDANPNSPLAGVSCADRMAFVLGLIDSLPKRPKLVRLG